MQLSMYFHSLWTYQLALILRVSKAAKELESSSSMVVIGCSIVTFSKWYCRYGRVSSSSIIYAWTQFVQSKSNKATCKDDDDLIIFNPRTNCAQRGLEMTMTWFCQWYSRSYDSPGDTSPSHCSQPFSFGPSHRLHSWLGHTRDSLHSVWVPVILGGRPSKMCNPLRGLFCFLHNVSTHRWWKISGKWSWA